MEGGGVSLGDSSTRPGSSPGTMPPAIKRIDYFSDRVRSIHLFSVKRESKSAAASFTTTLPAVRKDKADRIGGAMAFLRDLLSGGPVRQTTIHTKALEAGIAFRTLERAKLAIGVRSCRTGFGPGSVGTWELASAGESGIGCQ
jgi:hypothetical protein